MAYPKGENPRAKLQKQRENVLNPDKEPVKKKKSQIVKKYDKPGQPTKFNDEKIRKKILNGIRLGLPITQACQCADIHYMTLRNWECKALEEKEPEYIKFFEEVEKAKAEREAMHLNNIVTAARDGTWQASAWFLERSIPQRYTVKNRMEVTGKDGEAIQQEVTIKAVNPVDILSLVSPSIVIDADYKRLDIDEGETGMVCSGNNESET